MANKIKLEKDDEQRFVDWVESRGGKCYKWTGSRKKLDRIVVTHLGAVMLFEFKRSSDGRLSAHQEEILEHADAGVNYVRRSLKFPGGGAAMPAAVVVTSFENACEAYTNFHHWVFGTDQDAPGRDTFR